VTRKGYTWASYVLLVLLMTFGTVVHTLLIAGKGLGDCGMQERLRHEECIVGEGTGVHLYRDPQWGYDGCDYSGGLLLDGARQWERELSTRVGSDEKGEADLHQILRRLSWS